MRMWSKLSATLALVAVACGGATVPSEPERRQPTESSPGAQSSAVEISVVASAAPLAPPAPLPPPVFSDETKAMLRRLPAACPLGRFFGDVALLMDDAAIDAIDGLVDKLPKPPKPSAVAFARLKATGVHPLRAIKAYAECGIGEKDEAVMGMTVDLAKVDEPMSVVAKAFADVNGKKARIEKKGDLTWVTSGTGEVVVQADATTLLMGKRKALELALKSTEGEAGFDGAAGSLAWMISPKREGIDPFQFNARLNGDQISVRVLAEMGDRAVAARANVLQTRDQLPAMFGVGAPSTLTSVLEKLQVEEQSGVLIVSVDLPRDFVPLLLNDPGLQKMFTGVVP